MSLSKNIKYRTRKLQKHSDIKTSIRFGVAASIKLS